MLLYATFRKQFDFSLLPKDWRVFRISLDWDGELLILLQEGKPPRPPRNASIDETVKWLNFPPKAYHLLFWEMGQQHALTFQHAIGTTTCHIQRFEDRWLLCDSRGGRAVIYNAAGLTGKILHLGDAIEDIQTTRDGKIWVSYFDEGVFGNGIGSSGVVCFDSSGTPIFKYLDFANEHQLSPIDDCYAMNVVSNDEIWLSYYSEFPLVHLTNFQLNQHYERFGCMSGAFAVVSNTALFSKCYSQQEPQLLMSEIPSLRVRNIVEARDEPGQIIEGLLMTAARDTHFYMSTENAIYRMITPPK